MSICECGVSITGRGCMIGHLKSNRHFRLLKEKEDNKRLLDQGLYKSKIYKIVNNVDDKIYIGSTTQPLYKRINDHRKRYRSTVPNQYATKELFDTYGINNCQIVLIEEIEVHNVEEERKIEREWYDKLRHLVVNK